MLGMGDTYITSANFRDLQTPLAFLDEFPNYIRGLYPYTLPQSSSSFVFVYYFQCGRRISIQSNRVNELF